MNKLKYNLDHKSNIQNFQNDLYIYLNTKIDLTDDDQILKYTDEFVEYFNKIYKFVMSFENEIDNLRYEYEFEIFQIADKLSIKLIRLDLTDIHLITNGIGIICDKIKESDYGNIVKNLDYNYLIKINTYPYVITSITKSNEYLQHNNFYNGKYILLKNKLNLNYIEINFDNKLVYFVDPNVFQPDELNNEMVDEYGFKLYKNNLTIVDGPIIKLIPTNNPNEIQLDDELYQIDSESTVNIFNIIESN